MITVENGVPKLVVAQPKEITAGSIAIFNRLISQGVEAWIKAGKLLVQMVDANPNAYSIIMRDNPHLTPDILITFERIGRREVYPFLLLQKNPATAKLLSYDITKQEEFYKNPVELVVGMADGNPVVRKKLAMNMTKPEVALAFGPHGLRSVKEQESIFTSSPQHRPKTRISAGASTAAEHRSLKSIGHYKLMVNKDGQISLARVTGEHPFAMPIEIISGNESEVFEVLM
jgi:hypothetical protein